MFLNKKNYDENNKYFGFESLMLWSHSKNNCARWREGWLINTFDGWNLECVARCGLPMQKYENWKKESYPLWRKQPKLHIRWVKPRMHGTCIGKVWTSNAKIWKLEEGELSVMEETTKTNQVFILRQIQPCGWRLLSNIHSPSILNTTDRLWSAWSIACLITCLVTLLMTCLILPTTNFGMTSLNVCFIK